MRKRSSSRPVAVGLATLTLIGLVLSPLPTFTQGALAGPYAPAVVASQPQIVAQETVVPTSTLLPNDVQGGLPTFVFNTATRTRTPTRTPTPINIGNFVWDDRDHDGRQDAGEPGLAGVTVQLWNSAKNDLIDSDVTDANGIYTVVAPTPGNYRLRVLLPNPSLDNFSPKDQGSGASPDQNDSDINPSGTNFGFTDVMVLGDSLISTTIWDAGIIVYRPPTPTRTPTPINIGNFVWYDYNGDGHQDDNEPGIPDITVQLWNETKTQLIDQTITNAYGGYTVVAPVPGNYRVRVVLAYGGSFTLKDQGDDNLDSDINPSGPNAGFTDSFNLASNVISTVKYDAGLIALPSVTATPDFKEVYLPHTGR